MERWQRALAHAVSGSFCSSLVYRSPWLCRKLTPADKQLVFVSMSPVGRVLFLPIIWYVLPPAARHGGAAVGGGGVERNSDAVCRRRPPRPIPVVLPLPSHGVAHRRDVSVVSGGWGRGEAEMAPRRRFACFVFGSLYLVFCAWSVELLYCGRQMCALIRRRCPLLGFLLLCPALSYVLMYSGIVHTPYSVLRRAWGSPCVVGALGK